MSGCFGQDPEIDLERSDGEVGDYDIGCYEGELAVGLGEISFLVDDELMRYSRLVFDIDMDLVQTSHSQLPRCRPYRTPS